MEILGIDVGGSSVKGAVVNTETGVLVTAPVQLETPQPATPAAVVSTIATLVNDIGWQGALGCGFPAVVNEGVVKTAANIDSTWIGADLTTLLRSETALNCRVINDADAAGIAEMKFGAGIGKLETVLVLTLGTGIGSALFCGGKLVPNLELGHFPLNGAPAEHYASAAVRKKENLSWQDWGARLNEFLQAVERLLSPKLIIIGGGVSTEYAKFFPFLTLDATVVPARFFNQAGIIGAALAYTDSAYI